MSRSTSKRPAVNSIKEEKKPVTLGEKLKTKGKAERYLEKRVLGGDAQFVQSIESTFKPSKRTKKIIEDKKPVWNDEDDNRPPQSSESKSNWAKLSWQKPEEEEPGSDDEEESSLMKHAGNYMEKTEYLPKNVILVKPCSNANKECPSNTKLTSVQFHPTAQVILAAGMDNRLALFQVDGKDNPKVQSILMDTFPIYKARFSQDGKEVIMTSRLRAFYYYDMISGSVVNVPKFKGLEEKQMTEFEVSPAGDVIVFLGQEGHMHILSAKTKELIDTLKMNGTVEAIAFSPDGSTMYSLGGDGDIYVWDMKSRKCIHRFNDEGSFNGTALAVSKDNQYVAAGSQSGVVNIYNVNSVTVSRTPNPVKTVMNLTSPCTQLKFNSTSEILACASSFTENAMKLIHLPSFSVFQNFPTSTPPLRKPLCIDFSLRSGYLSVANNKGDALLYRLKHYTDY